MTTTTNDRATETSGQIAPVVIRRGAECGHCGKKYEQHWFAGDQVYCYEHTNGDVFSIEPNRELLLDLIEEREPWLVREVKERWQRKQGYLPEKHKVAVRCPDCGLVGVECDVFEGEKGVSGECPLCNERLMFA